MEGRTVYRLGYRASSLDTGKGNTYTRKRLLCQKENTTTTTKMATTPGCGSRTDWVGMVWVTGRFGIGTGGLQKNSFMREQLVGG